MDVREALHRSRSYRRFYQETAVPEADLMSIADAARLSPSGRNIQALKFLITNDRELNSRIFPTLAWAGYLPEWPGPEEGERPAAYIVQLLDTSIASGTLCDEGITAQSMLLQAVELGYGGCIIAAVKRPELHEILELPEHLNQVLAYIRRHPPRSQTPPLRTRHPSLTQKKYASNLTTKGALLNLT